MAATILIVEDQETLLEALKYRFNQEGYQILTARDGVEAVEIAQREQPELILLDIMLPRMDGLEVCRLLRKEMAVPILILTAKDTEADKIVGLEFGADDYVTKPFSLRELVARVKAMLRRAELARPAPVGPAPAPIRAKDLEIDLIRHQVTLGGRSLELKPKEFDLLAFLARNPGQVFTREHLLEKVWGYDYAGDTRTVDVHIRWLREKIETTPSHPRRILTVHGVGYKFEG